MSDDIKNAERDISTNVKQSLPEYFAIEKDAADLKRPRSFACHTMAFGLTSGTTMWNTVDLGRCCVSKTDR